MAAGKLDLPGNFQPGKSHLVKGETMIAWRRALVADRAVAGPGIKETGTPGGRVFEVANKDTLPGFYPYRWEQTGSTTWKCLLTPAMVAERSAATGTPPLAWHVPKIGGTPITSDPPPELTMTVGDYAILRLETEKSGEKKEADPEITAEPFTDGTFYVPPGVGPGGGDGQDGEYFFKLFRLEIVDGRPEILRFQMDDIEWMPWLWTGDVIGAGNGQIYRRYNPAVRKHEFRSIESPHAAFGGLGNPVTMVSEVQLRGNGVWQDVRFEECGLGGGSAELKGILAIRDGLASMHATEETVPECPDGIEPSTTTFTYANCHCCGEGP